ALPFERRQGELGIVALDHANDRIDVGDIDRAALFEHGIERFEDAPALVDGRSRTLEQYVVAARRGRNGEPLLDEREVLIEVAIKLGGEAVIVEGQFE